MALQVIGAGFGRTGTESLKQALEVLLGGTCHHMMEVFAHPQEVPLWQSAIDGDPVDWSFLDPYCASVDFPSSVFWHELADAHPEAPVLLSTRESAEVWWRSADATIFATTRQMTAELQARTIEDAPAPGEPDYLRMLVGMFHKVFGKDLDDAASAMAAYERHNAEVRAEVSPSRLIEYQPGDGWGAICDRLGLPKPDVAIAHTNTTAEFRQMAGLD